MSWNSCEYLCHFCVMKFAKVTNINGVPTINNMRVHLTDRGWIPREEAREK